MNQPVKHSKRRFGLSFRINGVITVLLVVLLAIATFSYRSLQDFSDQVSLFSRETLPALSGTINLTASLKEVVQGTERLMNSDIQASRRIAYEETSASLDVIKSSLREDSNIADSEELTTILDILSGTTVDLNKLIDERITLSARVRTIGQMVNDWILEDLKAPTNNNGSVTDPAYMVWFDQLQQTVTAAVRASKQESARDQTRTFSATNQQVRVLKDTLQTLSPQSQALAQRQLDGFFTHFLSPKGLFETQKSLNGITARSQALTRQMRVLVAELLRKTESLAFSNSAQAQAATEQLAAKIEQQVTLLLIGVAFAISIAVLSYIFIERQVIRRLLSLRAAVTDRASGGHEAVPVHGQDEVTDIGKAVQFFIEEIDGRQQQLQANAQQLQSVIRLSPQPMCIANATEILYSNEAYIALWAELNKHAPFDAKLGHSVIPKKLLPQNEDTPIIHMSRYAMKGTAKTLHWFDLSSSPIEWQGTPARQLIAIDVTKQVQVEQTLEEARRKAEAAAQSKSNFLAMMSHEIRSPMNGIISVGEILGNSKLDGEQQQLVNVINQSAETLLTILNDILDLSKIDAGKLEITKTDFELPQMIHGVTNLLATGFEQKGLPLTIDIAADVPTLIRSDANRIRQILFNLLGNALKFTENGSVSVNITTNEAKTKTGKVINIAVKDTGVGIAPDVIERLFQPFEQADSTTARQYGGTGLGLSICKRLAELLDGKITVTSSVGKGSEFILHIPLETAKIADSTMAAVPDQSETTKASQQQKLNRILVVEDNKVNQLVIGKILKSLGYQWDTADDGLNALEIYDPQIHDLILTDLRMPRMDGFALARTIRADETGEGRVPIIALSADAMDEARQLSKQSGIDDFLTKPVKVEDIRQCLNNY